MKQILIFILPFLFVTGARAMQHEDERQNIIYVMTDQQAHDAMSCAGNTLVSTPSLDRLAAKGLRFENAYCAYPLCVPSRAAMFTGHMPHEAGIFVNTRVIPDEDLAFETLARHLSKSGYATHYIGKWHLTIPRSDTLQHGFQGIDYSGAHGHDAEHTQKAIEYLQKEHAQPFFLVVSLVNPHDCCQLARKEDLSDFEGPIPPLPPADQLPVLAENFDVPENEPDYIRTWQALNSERVYRSYFWDEADFREYQWGYYRLVEKVDSLVGNVLGALEASAYDNNTTVIFSSDHGDGSSRHRWNQKWSAYDESSRVPFIVAGAGVSREGQVDERLVSAGLDLFPTICDLAGVETPPGMRGKSVAPVLKSDTIKEWRSYVATELSFGNWVDEYQVDTFPRARMIRSKDYKYVAFDRGALREQLIHMGDDPGEMFNLALDPEYRDILEQHRKYLKDWIKQTEDNFDASPADSNLDLYRAAAQLQKSLDWMGDTLASPRYMENGMVRLVPPHDWTSGFYPGMLWMMYEFTELDDWKDAAHRLSMNLEDEKYNGGTHDMGFKLYCSLGNGYRITGDTNYRDILIQGARTLAGRFNPMVGSLRSWDFNRDEWEFPVIIDNMMNLEMLFWATRETGDSTYYNIALSHAINTLRDHFRPDYSSYHVISYDTITGEIEKRHTHQGYSHQSAWSRGQAWGLYGFTMTYRETGKEQFLEQAKCIASYILDHPNMPVDIIPYWDFNAPGQPDIPRDASAAAITASALIELSYYCKAEKEAYIDAADQILLSLGSDKYRIQGNHSYPFILDHSTGRLPRNTEIDCPIVYADYYYIEALMRRRIMY